MSGLTPDLLPGIDQELAERLSSDLERVEAMLHEQTHGYDAVLDERTGHLAPAGGKRLRPALTLLCAELGPRPTDDKVYDAAVLVELTHLATLYHDDVMDDAPVRRGVPSAHEVFGPSQAILAGDVLFARASIIAAGLGTRAVRQHSRTFERLCAGQLHETVGPLPGQDPLEHYLGVLADKTGSLIAASALYGAQASGADPSFGEAVRRFGEKVGVAFQLADDVIDLEDSHTTGKTPGTDLREGVETMPVLLLRAHAKDGTLDEAGQAILAELDHAQSARQAGDEILTDKKVAAVVPALREHAVTEEVRSLARSWADEAVDELAVLPAGPVRDALGVYSQLMVDRMS